MINCRPHETTYVIILITVFVGIKAGNVFTRHSPGNVRSQLVTLPGAVHVMNSVFDKLVVQKFEGKEDFNYPNHLSVWEMLVNANIYFLTWI